MTIRANDSRWGSCEQEVENRTRSQIVLKDKGAKSEYRGENAKREEFITILVDGCLIVGHNNKCDYLLLDANRKIAKLIELKGLDYKHGIEQIKNTFLLIRGCLMEMGYKNYKGLIACSRSPHIKDANYKKMKDNLYREFGILLNIKGNNRFVENLNV